MVNLISFQKEEAKRSSAVKFASGLLAFGCPFLAALLVYSSTAAAGLTWLNGGDDGGDLATATALLGIPHPTGYSFYILSNQLFLWLSPEIARALNLASAFWGAMGVGLISLAAFHFFRHILKSPENPPPEKEYLFSPGNSGKNRLAGFFPKILNSSSTLPSLGGLLSGLVLPFPRWPGRKQP